MAIASTGSEPTPGMAGRKLRLGGLPDGAGRGLVLAMAVTALLGPAPPAAAAEARNLAAARLGTVVIKRTSEQRGEWRAERLIDEQLTPAGWASQDGSFPQEIVLRLPARMRFNTLVFNATSAAPSREWARELEVYTADPFPTMGGWKRVARVVLAPEPVDQTFPVAEADGRFVRIAILSAQTPGAPRVSLNEVKLFLR